MKRTTAKAETAADLAHDLRTPLMRIGGFADLLFDQTRAQLDDNSRHYLRRILESTYEMGCMIDEVLRRPRG